MNPYRSSIDVPSVIESNDRDGFCQNQQAKDGETDRKSGDGDKKAGRGEGSALRIVDTRRNFDWLRFTSTYFGFAQYKSLSFDFAQLPLTSLSFDFAQIPTSRERGIESSYSE